MGHTVTEKARRSEWQTSDRYLAFECNCMQQKHERKNDGVSRRCLGMYNGLTQRRDQWSRLHPQESEFPESTPVGTGGGVGGALAEAIRLQTGPLGKASAVLACGGEPVSRDSGFCFVSGTGRAKLEGARTPAEDTGWGMAKGTKEHTNRALFPEHSEMAASSPYMRCQLKGLRILIKALKFGPKSMPLNLDPSNK